MKLSKINRLCILLLIIGTFSNLALAEMNSNPNQVIFNFSVESGLNGWVVEDDGVMGGLSQGGLKIDSEGHAVFSGEVSLKNNGGFSSIQHNFPAINVSNFENAYIRLKGDGKRYQFRVKSSRSERPSYIYDFGTTGEWETVKVPLEKMYPTFRGNRLSIPDYPKQILAHLRFMIANGTAESFKLVVDKIWLK